MPSTRRALIEVLKRAGTMQAHALAAELGITVAAVRQQLGRLEEDGLVTHGRDAEGRGRPAHTYQLTPAAEALYPKRYGDLTTELLGYLGGPESTRGHGTVRPAPETAPLDGATARLADLPLEKQVAELTAILDEDGYLADVERIDGGGWRITEHNCAILSVATGYRQACSSELAFIRQALPGARVERVAHLMDGAHVCAYEVHPKDGGTRRAPTQRAHIPRRPAARTGAARTGSARTASRTKN